MSLTGNLEDLPLLDILQIVSFSKKTGFLAIEAEIGHGAIVFDGGFVVAAFTWETPPLDPRARALAPEKRDVILRGRIEMALEQLIRMREGLFNFSLTDHVPFDVADRDIEFELLSQGINAQELLLDLARGMDEDRRDSTAAVEASFAAAETDMDAGARRAARRRSTASRRRCRAPPRPPPPAAASHAAAVAAPHAASARDRGPPRRPHAYASIEGRASRGARRGAGRRGRRRRRVRRDAFRTILLVDDEADVRQVLGEHFARGGYTVVEAEDPDGAVKKGTALAKAGTGFLLIVDLGMPTTGGTSFHGGFEAVRKLAKAGVKPPVLLMIESLTTPIQTRAKELGIKSFVFKPGLSKLDPEQFEADLKAFAAKIAADVLPRLARQATEQAAAPPPGAAPASPSPAAPPKPAASAAPTKPAAAPAPPARRPPPPRPPTSCRASWRCWGSGSTSCGGPRTRRRSRPWSWAWPRSSSSGRSSSWSRATSSAASTGSARPPGATRSTCWPGSWSSRSPSARSSATSPTPAAASPGPCR